MRTEYGIRKLTPKECWRLMGFADEDFIKAQSAGISDRQLYKQAGNSIVVDVLYYIFKNLFDRNEMITVNELFSGVGAQRNALLRLGQPHKVIGIAEIDKYAVAAYNAIYGSTRNYGDISKVQRLDYADLWTYSFPCTDISICGQLQGMIQGETRSGLLYEVQRLLEQAEQRPKYLLLENVKNLVSKRFKPQFDEWCKFLDSMGYNTYWQILNAKNYGIPQNRERVFAVSVRKDIDNGTFRFPEPVDSGLRCDDLLDGRVDEKYYYHTPKAAELMNELIENPTMEQGTLFAETADEELKRSILSRYHISDKPIQSVNCIGGGSSMYQSTVR